MKANTSRFGVMRSAVSLSPSRGDSGRAGGEELRPRRSSQGRPPRGSYLRGDVRHRAVSALFRVLEAPGRTGMTHPEMQVFRSAG